MSKYPAPEPCTWCSNYNARDIGAAMHWRSAGSARLVAVSCSTFCGLQIEALRDHVSGVLDPVVLGRARGI